VPQCEPYLEVLFDANFQRVKESSFMRQIMFLEEKHGLNLPKLMVAVIYCQSGQTDPLVMFKNRDIQSPAWHKFLQDMSITPSRDVATTENTEHDKTTNPEEPKDDVNLTSPSYGLLPHLTTNSSIPTPVIDDFPSRIWKSKKVVFHVAPLMDDEQHRRLVGNDNAIIFFKDFGDPFDPSDVTQLGNMAQSFIVVQPHGNKYRLGCFHRRSLAGYTPGLQKGYLFDPGDICDFILCKLHNGILTAYTCPPMNRLIQRPRAVAIAETIEKHILSKSGKTNFFKIK